MNTTDKKPLYVHLYKCNNQVDKYDLNELHEHFVNNYKFKYFTQF
jgi:hypothetical protein